MGSWGASLALGGLLCGRPAAPHSGRKFGVATKAPRFTRIHIERWRRRWRHLLCLVPRGPIKSIGLHNVQVATSNCKRPMTSPYLARA